MASWERIARQPSCAQKNILLLPDPGSLAQEENGCLTVWLRLVHRDLYGIRLEAVGNPVQLAGSGFHVRRHVKIGVGRERLCGNTHRAMVVRASIKDMPGSVVNDPDQRVVGRRFELVAERRRLRPAIEAAADRMIRLPTSDARRGKDHE